MKIKMKECCPVYDIVKDDGKEIDISLIQLDYWEKVFDEFWKIQKEIDKIITQKNKKNDKKNNQTRNNKTKNRVS